MSRVRAISRPLVLAGLLALAGGGAGCAGLARTDSVLFPPPERGAVTFWGHACTYIDVGGVGIVTDPVFKRSLFLRRRRIPAPPPSAYAGARVILISHAHPDHLDPATLRTFPQEALILCPAPSAKYLDDVGRDARVMHPGDVFSFAGGSITAVAVHHMGTRWGLAAGLDGRALGYVIETDDATIFYSGDTNYFSGFAGVGWTFEPDIVMLNVNGHLTSTGAVRAAWASRASFVIPLHWGTYPYWIFGGSHRPRDEETLRRLIGDRLRVLEVGQSLPLSAVSRGGSALP